MLEGSDHYGDRVGSGGGGEMVVVLSRVVGLGPTEREQKEWMRLHGGERPA